ncbi:MAG: DNA polymerase III subunit delta' [Xanthobacteraceae bacterium]
MSARATETIIESREPRLTTALFGHHDAEQMLLDAYRSGRIPHAWLIGGAQGIGKATLAYRMARFVLAHRDPAAPEVQQASSLHVDESHPVARQVASGAHGGLLTLQRGLNEKGVLRNFITVDDTRRTIEFFGSTAAVDGWRVCIVDTVDEFNANAANALLKILEEPPRRSILLLLSHAPGKVLPTIQSRCRRLALRPLTPPDVAAAVAAATGETPDTPAVIEAAEVSEGSVGRALNLMGGNALKLHQRTAELLAALPHVDQRQLHALGDALGGSDRTTLAAFTDSVDRWVTGKLRGEVTNADLAQLARLAEVWEKISRAARDVESFNLDRKPLVFSVFDQLSEATR